MLLYYRADLFDEFKLSPPNTWDEYLEVAKKLTLDRDGDGKIDVYGNDLMAGLSHHNTMLWMQRYLSMAGKRELEGTLWDKSRKPIFNNPQGQAALKAYKDMLAFAPPGAISYQYADSITAFQKGIVAMAEQWTMAYGPMNDPKRSTVAGKVKVALIPGTMHNGQLLRTPHLGGWSMGVNRNSRQKDAAYKFVEWLCFTMDAQKAHKSATPSRTSSYAKLDIAKDENLRTVFGHLPLIGQSLPMAQTRPRTTYTQELVDTLSTSIHETLVGKKQPADSLATAEKEWARLLNKK
jgi:multiple sugar transport system substrate-binding protein